MIGLGSNRLTVCRRGGMSVTQAGRGGMEWLAGGRLPSWASPYSAQATAALLAQFPTQWPTIRDYGFAHSALVPFINEDPMLVCSLMELGKVRRIIADKDCWIATGFYPRLTSGIEWDFQLISRENSESELFAVDAGSTGNQGFGLMIWDYKWVYMYGNFSLQGTVLTGVNYHYSQLAGLCKMTGDNGYSETVNRGTTSAVANLEMRFPGDNRNGSGGGGCKLKSPRLALSTDGVTLKEFVPFVSTIRNGMLDIHDLEHPVFHPNMGTGTFGTEITDSPS